MQMFNMIHDLFIKTVVSEIISELPAHRRN